MQTKFDTVDPCELAARTYKQAIFILLYNMFYGATRPTEGLYAKVEP